MDWAQAIDIYCERTSAAFWAEPANALSNLSFIAAAIWAAVTARRIGERSAASWMLILLAGAIGVGSFLFHTFANRWSSLADTLPIWTFVACFVVIATIRIGSVPPRKVLVIAAILVLSALAIAFLASGEGVSPAPPDRPDPLNGSGQYAPALIALLVFSLLTRWRRHPAAPWVAAATGVFLISLLFRTLDRDICMAFPLGTHWLWHLLNGAMIALLLQMLLRSMRPTRQ